MRTLVTALAALGLGLALTTTTTTARAQGRIRIVSIGDSLASGEGNPDVNAPFLQWDGSRDAVANGWGNPADLAAIDGQDWTCHRSQLPGHKLAADTLGAVLPSDDVQFTSVACSGATIPDLVDNSQFGGVIPQLTRVAQLFPPTSPDAGIDVLLISIGINDVGFGEAVKAGLTEDMTTDPAYVDGAPSHADAWLTQPGTRPDLDGDPAARAAKLRVRWNRLIAAVETRLPNVGMVIVHEYPSGMTDRFGNWCHGFTHVPVWIPVIGTQWIEVPLDDALIAISGAESQWAGERGIDPLNQTLAAAVAGADPSRWQFVGGIASQFRGHGFCAGATRFINTVGDATLVENDVTGSVHPNANGHAVYATALRNRLAAVDWTVARATPATPTFPAPGAVTSGGLALRMLTTTNAQIAWDHGGTPAMFFQVARRMSTDTAAPPALGSVPWRVPGAPTSGNPRDWFDPSTGWLTSTRAAAGGARSVTFDVAPSGPWRVSVRACSLERCSAWSPATLIDTVPPTPTGLWQTGSSATTVGLGWTGGSALTTRYQVAWHPTSSQAWTYLDVAPIYTSTKIITGAGQFDAFVRACGVGGCSRWAGGLVLANVVPPAPTNLNRWPTTDASLFGVWLNWSNPATVPGSMLQVVIRDSATHYATQLMRWNATTLAVDWEEASWIRACNTRYCSAWSQRIGGPAELPPATAPIGPIGSQALPPPP